MYMYHCIYVHVHVYINYMYMYNCVYVHVYDYILTTCTCIIVYMYMYNCIAEVRVLLLAMCQSDYFLQLFY